jgi:hypothetical protein
VMLVIMASVISGRLAMVWIWKHSMWRLCQLRKMDSIAGLRGGVLSFIYRPWDPGPRRA